MSSIAAPVAALIAPPGCTVAEPYLRRADVGLIGFGNLGRALHPLLVPFQPTVRAYDPWLPPAVLLDRGIIPASLAETLASSQFLFVLATVTDDSRHLLGAEQLDLVPDGARLVLVSRAPWWTSTRC